MTYLKFLAFLSFLLITNRAQSFSFDEALEALKKHETIEALQMEAESLKEEGDIKGSWGDPSLSLSAKNFPQDSLSRDDTPMTGLEIGISQKVNFTTKYGNIEDAFDYLSRAKKQDSFAKERELLQAFWSVLIELREMKEESEILNENMDWVENNLKLSKKLYANGTISQQVLLDVQIRKSDLEAKISNIVYAIKKENLRLAYILNLNGTIDLTTVPWDFLNQKTKDSNNPEELSLAAQLKSKEKLLTASRLNYFPDLQFSFSYTKRSEEVDNVGDFVSASISFPLPFSATKYSQNSKALYEKESAHKKLSDYQRFKTTKIKTLEQDIEMIKKELDIINEKSLKYAKSSRSLASKAYSLGSISYTTLLTSELKYQDLLLKKSRLNAKLAKAKVDLKSLAGDRLYE